MKHLIISLFSAVLLLGAALPARAGDETGPAPTVSFGLAGSYGWYNNWLRKGGDMILKHEFAPGYGGAFVFEKMFNNIAGIHTGLWFNQMNLVMKLKSRITSLSIEPMSLAYTKMKVEGWTFSFPLSLVTSLNASFFSFQIHAGIKYTQIITSRMTHNNQMLSVYRRKMDMMSMIYPSQFGFTLGLFFKFRTVAYVDIFFGGEGELYVTQMIKHNNDVSHLIGLTVQAGVMFRTNIFPMTAPAEQAAL
ncbi:MAG TPA: hypothetical protein PLM53_02325 [Spirochaetota bacterium]|nr:hypothetical protein [Spirochaetota bacterium]HPC43230.1 hypothetical protein [Spirochaetota bacterium]HPL16530.1 hypothetical protein [Spirochaetota bacterium]HQF06689.1 hypothetical protein [Spirochaetota bacterium]HQH95908.1 hypothetical protein [Spirochaetota bacterium]